MRLRLPHWSARPWFGVAVLFGLAVLLVVHGEPQPSSRPSGTSVVVSGSATAPATQPRTLLLRDGQVVVREQAKLHAVPLPAGARARSIVSGRGLSVVLAALDGRQRAYAITANLAVRDLGYADAVLPSGTAGSAILVETALVTPGTITEPAPTQSAATRSATSSDSSSPSSGEQPPLQDYLVRRYDVAGRPVGDPVVLPRGTRAAVDTRVGLVVWKPVSRVFDAGVARESLSAAAELVRPDNTIREIGPVHPLAATSTDLLVWDVAQRRFGLMPLEYVTSTATTTATPTASHSAKSPTPEASPTTVAGTRWFEATRGFVVTGPATFSDDGSTFAVYAQVGPRRRLVVAELKNVGTDQIDVLALQDPLSRPTSNGAESSSRSSSAGQPSPGQTASGPGPSSSATATVTEPPSAIAADGFPIPAPLAPLWWGDTVVALGIDGQVVGYQPGSRKSSPLDIGVDDAQALATMP